ncbi:DUF4328 domain-containing protein [Bacillus piscicola]|uniref:DUF4328 domain-containing protein n=1 Tax=Bacillus piscicola TaxID=1632684 RepID=UPI001F096283|nr:DUF4328 domain-containing protein [Bacillus piscicola]
MNNTFTFKSPKKTAVWSIAFIVATLMFSTGSMVGSIMERNIYESYPAAASFSQLADADKQTLAIITAGVDIPKTIFFIVSICVFFIWVYRVHANGHALQLNGIINVPGWAVTVYMIPVVNLVIPLISLLHLHKSSVSRASANINSSIKSGTWNIYAWWILFWGSYLAALPGNMTAVGDTVELLRKPLPFFIISDVLYIVSGIFLIIVIRKITAVQEKLKKA